MTVNEEMTLVAKPVVLADTSPQLSAYCILARALGGYLARVNDQIRSRLRMSLKPLQLRLGVSFQDHHICYRSERLGGPNTQKCHWYVAQY